MTRTIPQTESLTVEFKSDRNRLSDNDLIEAVICLSNTEGGILYLGVEDSGEVTGINPGRTEPPASLEALIANRTNPPLAVHCESLIETGKQVVAITVPSVGQPVARSDGLLKRRRLLANGRPECIPFLPSEFASRLSGFRLVDLSAQPVTGAFLDDLDIHARAQLRTLVQRNPKADKALLKLADEELDGALNITVSRSGERTPTLLGLLLIGQESALRRLVPSHEILFQVMDGTRVLVNESTRRPLVEAAGWIETLSTAVNTQIEIPDGLFRFPVSRVDADAFREAVNNALVHRDYAKLGPVRICWESDRLTISNPGGFVEGVSLNNLLTTEPRPRNPALADAFKRLGLVERTGRGVDIIYSGMLRFGRPVPDYNESLPDLIKVALSTEAPDLDFLRIILREEERQQGELPVETLLVLNQLRGSRRLNPTALAALLQTSEARAAHVMERLVESGLVQPQGAGAKRHYTLSPQMYRHMGQRDEYIRQAGFDQLQQIQMIKNYIREHGRIQRQGVATLCRLDAREAGYLLERLVRSGQLERHGVRRAAYYLLKTTGL